MRTIEDLKSVAVFARDRLNPYLFNYCLSVALLHRPDTRDLDLPSFINSFPDKFVDGSVLQAAREESELVDETNRVRKWLLWQKYIIQVCVLDANRDSERLHSFRFRS